MVSALRLVDGLGVALVVPCVVYGVVEKSFHTRRRT